MNARQKAKKYKSDLEFYKNQLIAPNVIYRDEKPIVHLRAEEIADELLFEAPDYREFCKHALGKKLIAEIMNLSKITIIDTKYGKKIQCDIGIVDYRNSSDF